LFVFSDTSLWDDGALWREREASLSNGTPPIAIFVILGEAVLPVLCIKEDTREDSLISIQCNVIYVL